MKGSSVNCVVEVREFAPVRGTCRQASRADAFKKLLQLRRLAVLDLHIIQYRLRVEHVWARSGPKR